MTEALIASLPAEQENLSLHVQLCEQRYLQLLAKFDDVDRKFDRIENILVDINQKIRSDTTELYLKWAGGIIFVLATALIGLVTKIIA